MKTIKDVIAFEWNEANISHIAKHEVKPEECEQAFFDDFKKQYEDAKHSQKEARNILIGKTKNERILYIVYTIRKNKIRVVSARTLNKREVRLYEEEI